jgi:DNA topoisomerase-1
MRDVDSDELVKKQLGTILWFIDNHGIRVGNEKGEDEADTVGASTLRVEHVKFSKGHITFDFLGKDSIKFYKQIKVPTNILNNLKLFVRGKSKGDEIFDKVSSSSINSYLKTFDTSFSAKVFRTRLASTIMFNRLSKITVPTGSTKAEIKKLFNKANSEVADILNHTRNVSQRAKESVQKDIEKVRVLQIELEETKNDNSRNKIETQIQKLKDRIEAKTDVLKVAITTSLNNYIDPRLVVSWVKKNNIELSDIYSQTLMKKFNWAISTTGKNWNYLKSPIRNERQSNKCSSTLSIK